MDPNAPQQPNNEPAPTTETNPLPPVTEPAPTPQPSVVAQQFEQPAPVTATQPVAAPVDGGKLPSAFSLFKPSVEAVKLNLNSFLLLVLLPAVYFVVVSLLDKPSYTPSSAIVTSNTFGMSGGYLILSAAGLLYMLFTFAGVVFLQLKSAQGQKAGYLEAIKGGLHYFWRLVGLYIVIGLLVGIGFLLLIVPGVIMLRRYFLSPYFLVDKDLSISDAMKQSAAATKGRAMAVWGVLGVLFLLSLPGVIPVIGSFVSAVLGLLYSCAPALRYGEVKNLPPAQ